MNQGGKLCQASGYSYLEGASALPTRRIHYLSQGIGEDVFRCVIHVSINQTCQIRNQRFAWSGPDVASARSTKQLM